MTKRYPGGYITKTPPTVSTTSAPGIWTMEQQAAYQKAGTWPFGGPFNYIEDVFSTWLYTGNGSTQTITNGIDLAGQGGLTWVKTRSNTLGHVLVDTVRGAGKYLSSNTTNQQFTNTDTISAFTSSGFTVGNDNDTNSSGATYASWTFRKQPKFFDVQTWTGDGSTAWRYLNHNLGSTPKCIIIKRTDTTSNWVVWHNDGSTDRIAFLNTTAAADGTNGSNGYAFGISPTQFVLDTVGGSVTASNAIGGTYVAYLFAHDAGGFGLTGTDNVISCGSFTTEATYGNATVNLGYEAQWVMAKRVDSAADWYVSDNMRGMPWNDYPSGAAGTKLSPNTATTETALWMGSRSTGFSVSLAPSATYIYIAIRRGPMKTPTSGTSVYQADITENLANPNFTSGFPVDMALLKTRASVEDWYTTARLTGTSYLSPNTTAASLTSSAFTFDFMNGWEQSAADNRTSWMFRRAPGFFDEVCYTGTGSARTLNHNLGVVPELMIVKRRSASASWAVYSAALGNTGILFLDLTNANSGPDTQWNSTTPTASVFSVGSNLEVNSSGSTYVAYLFASCPGVSKVGSYTGNGSTQTIDCGFTGGARFVLIKRTDSTGDWWVWDTARGMVAGTDPRLALNATSAETNANWVYTDASGFQIVTTDATVNASGGSYIYLAIA